MEDKNTQADERAEVIRRSKERKEAARKAEIADRDGVIGE